MDSWTRVIVEWVNCLGIAQPSIEDLQDFQDGVFYQKLVTELSHGSEKSSETTSPTSSTTLGIDEGELVSNFINAEYPEFIASNECGASIPRELYTASLLLTQCSQKAAFHRPMCANLKHESQIYIKKFLELVLPYGKSLTKEVIGVAIMELGDATPNTPPSTPLPSRPLREFFNSPAARSAQSQRFMNDRNRELRRLRAQLETEQFEKTDLIEDIRMHEEKIQNLQKKLQEKSQELKALRNERMKPLTPQSCRKNKRPSDSEERWKREFEQLENANAELLSEIDKLQEEREELSRRLVSKDRMHAALKERFDQAERSMETLTIQLEMKNNELLDMRMNNEELREHIREIQRSSLGEQSFEMEPICRARSPVLMNSSEALSSIVDIQLQEAKLETCQLRLQLESLNQRLETVMNECEETKRLNAVLQEKAVELDNVRLSLANTEKQLFSSTAKVTSLESEKSELSEKLKKLEASLESNEELLALAEKRREGLENDLTVTNSRTRELEHLLHNEKSRVEELQSTVFASKKESEDLQALLEKVKEALKTEKSANAELQDIVSRSKEISEELESLLRSKEDLLERALQRESSLDAELGTCRLKIAELESSLSSESSRSAELELALSRANGAVKSLKTSLASTEGNLAETEAKKELFESELRKADATIRETEESIRNLRSELTNVKEEKMESLLAKAKIEEYAKVADGKIVTLESKISDCEIRIKELDEARMKEIETLTTVRNELISGNLRIDTLTHSLEESEHRESETAARLEVSEKRVAELTELKEEMESQLAQEKEQFAKISAEQNILEEKLSSYMRLEAALKEEVGKLQRELEGSQKNLDEQNSENITLKTNEKELQGIRDRLEEKLRQEQKQLEATLSEKSALGKELACNIELVTNMEKQIERILKELEETNYKLQEQNTVNAELKKNEHELQQMKVQLEEKLRKEQNDLEVAINENGALQKDVASYVESVANLEERIAKNKMEFDESSKNLHGKIQTIQKELKKSNNNRKDQHTVIEKLKENELELQEIKIQLEDKLREQQSELEVAFIEKDTLQKEVASYVESVANLQDQLAKTEREFEESSQNLQGQIQKIQKQLEEANQNLHEQNTANAELKKSELKLQEMKVQLEDELKQHEKQLEITLSEKTALQKEVASYIASVTHLEEQIAKNRREFEKSSKDLQEQIQKIQKELEESHKNLQAQNTANENLKKSELAVQGIQIQLEDKLRQEQNQLEITLTEKRAVQKELESYVQSAVNLKAQLGKIEKELEDSNKNLQEQSVMNAALEKDKIELVELRSNLINQIKQKQRELAANKTENDALNEQLISHIHSAAKLEEQIKNISKDIEECQKNLQDQLAANELLRQEKSKQEEETDKLEKELAQEREQLAAVRSEKEMFEEEASLFGRCNEELGGQIVTLKAQLEANCKDLQDKHETIAALKKNELDSNSLREKLESQLAEGKDQLARIQIEKNTLEQELSSFVRSKADMVEEISALHTELESSRKDLQRLQDINEKLKEKTLEANTKIESLQVFEAQTSQLTRDLESAKSECASFHTKIADLSKESERRAEQISVAEKQFEEMKRENDRLASNLEERIQSSNDLVSSLEKRLLSSQNACAEAKIEEKLKEEALGVLQVKLEQLTKEKIESELRMKEVILNLQEVRASQDGVLEAQVKALEEKSSQLEEAEKELVSLKTSLEARSSELEREKLRTQNFEAESQKLKENEEKQSKFMQKLEEALESERQDVKEWTRRCEELKQSLEDIAKVSASLKLELNELWNSVSQACPDIVELCQKENSDVEEILDTAKLPNAMRSFADDAKTINKVVATLAVSNEKLKNNMEAIANVSRSLQFELDALWDSVRQSCPELARPKEEITCLEETLNNLETTEIFCAVQSFAEDAKRLRKAVSILSEANETLKEHLDGEKEITKSSASEAEKQKIEFDERISNMENEREKSDQYLSLLVRRKKDLQELLSNAVSKRDEVDEELGVLTEKWRTVSNEAQSVLHAGSSACDELKHLQIWRTELDTILFNVNERHARSLKPLLKALCRIFLWSETKLHEAQLISTIVKNEFSPQNELSDEQELLMVEIRHNEKVQEDLKDVRNKIDSFSSLLESYESSLKTGVIKREAGAEAKLQAQVEKISKERMEMKDKLDAMRTRNAKLEKNMDDLRNENKKLKNEVSSVTSTNVEEVERLEKLTEKLEKEILRLQKDNEELSKNQSKDQTDEMRLKEVHNEYGLKLEKIKQKMKTAYNEQIAKLNQEQEKAMKDKIEVLRGQMEQQCRKYTEDIAKYKAHITDLSSRYWDVGEKLLAETQEKQAALQQLQQLKGQQVGAISEINQQTVVTHSRQKTASLDRRDFSVDRAARESTARAGYRAVEVIEEETTTRRHSVRSIQAMGNAFKAEDEEGEVFDSVYLADLKEGRCLPMGPDYDRLSELRMRNSMCRPHLRSSYAVETHVQPITLNEDDIKNGVTGDDVFNDSLSQSLLPGQKPKKKDRTQTSYKRPGPPTPSKNGGRLSLQGNELKSPGSRILRERNVERRTTATPRGLKNLFGNSISKRQDENVAGGTPKGRRLSNIFRKQRTERN